jgi:hypothetical protein
MCLDFSSHGASLHRLESTISKQKASPEITIGWLRIERKRLRSSGVMKKRKYIAASNRDVNGGDTTMTAGSKNNKC